MTYIAKINIGDYKAGDVVPDEKAEVWDKMYKISPVEKKDGKESKKEESSEKEVNLDVNGDGKVDKKDYSEMAKAMGKRSAKKRKKSN